MEKTGKRWICISLNQYSTVQNWQFNFTEGKVYDEYKAPLRDGSTRFLFLMGDRGLQLFVDKDCFREFDEFEKAQPQGIIRGDWFTEATPITEQFKEVIDNMQRKRYADSDSRDTDVQIDDSQLKKLLEHNKKLNIQIGKLIERQRQALIDKDFGKAKYLDLKMDGLAEQRYKIEKK